MTAVPYADCNDSVLQSFRHLKKLKTIAVNGDGITDMCFSHLRDMDALEVVMFGKDVRVSRSRAIEFRDQCEVMVFLAGKNL